VVGTTGGGGKWQLYGSSVFNSPETTGCGYVRSSRRPRW
jgi:hypothetical protein